MTDSASTTGKREPAGRERRRARAYFKYGNSARRFNKIRDYAVVRLAGFITKHCRSRVFGRWVIAFSSDNQLSA